MTKEEIAALFSGKPVVPKPTEIGTEREIHIHEVNYDNFQHLSKAIFQQDEQASFSDTLAVIADKLRITMPYELVAACGQAICLEKVLSVPTLSYFLRGFCFTRDGYVCVDIHVNEKGLALGATAKKLAPFPNGYSEEAVVIAAKECAKKLRENHDKHIIDGNVPIERTPEQVAEAISAAVAKLAKED